MGPLKRARGEPGQHDVGVAAGLVAQECGARPAADEQRVEVEGLVARHNLVGEVGEDEDGREQADGLQWNVGDLRDGGEGQALSSHAGAAVSRTTAVLCHPPCQEC